MRVVSCFVLGNIRTQTQETVSEKVKVTAAKLGEGQHRCDFVDGIRVLARGLQAKKAL